MSAEGGGGGHGASWIVTYSDMITLLMTLFIVIVTFGSRSQDRAGKKNDSLVGGKGGSGAASLTPFGGDKTAVLLRVTALGRSVIHGSESAPTYSDLSSEPVESVLSALKEAPPGRLSDNFCLRVSGDFLFADGDRLSESGARALGSIASAVRQLPYDIQIQVNSQERLPRASRVMQYLFQMANIHPGRIGIGVRPTDGDGETIRLLLVRNR